MDHAVGVMIFLVIGLPAVAFLAWLGVTFVRSTKKQNRK